MWWKIILAVLVFIVGIIVIIRSLRSRYITIPRVIINDVIIGIEYIIPKPTIVKFVAVKMGDEGDVQYIRPTEDSFFVETYDVDGKNDLLSVRLLVVRKISSEYTHNASAGCSIVYKRDKRLYLAKLAENKSFCTDYEYMKDHKFIRTQEDSLHTNLQHSYVRYDQVVGVVVKTFDCYKPTNKKEGIA